MKMVILPFIVFKLFNAKLNICFDPFRDLDNFIEKAYRCQIRIRL